jgi:hypothetical protein
VTDTSTPYAQLVAECRHGHSHDVDVTFLLYGADPIQRKASICISCQTVVVAGKWEPSRVAPALSVEPVTGVHGDTTALNTETGPGSTPPAFVPRALAPAFEEERSGGVKALAWGVALGFGVALWYLAARAVFGVWR